MTLIAAACATAKEHRQRWALLSGAATGLGLAIGIEALPFHLLIGVSYALQAITGGEERDTTRSYALFPFGSIPAVLLPANAALAMVDVVL